MKQYLGVTETFNFQELETKGEREYYISGYISTKAIDKYNDLITDECLDDILVQIKSGSIKIDFEHETIHEDNLNKNPVARVVDAKKDEKGVWVKALINSANTRFNEIWGSIKQGFIDSFSIAFKPIETATRYIQGKAVRVLNKLKLFNIGLTGTPVNDECKMDKIIVKAISEFENKEVTEGETEVKEQVINEIENKETEETSHSSEQSEDNKMAEQETQVIDQPAENKEVVENTQTEEVQNEVEETQDNISELEAEVKSLKAEIEELKKRPQFKALSSAEPITKLKNVTPLGLIG